VSERQGHDETVLPDQTSDDTDAGWGERQDDELSDEERLIREKPPHW
jgi:hypothetical protein